VKGSDSKSQALKGVSEYGEMADAVLKSDKEKIIDGIGDVIVVLTILAAQEGLDIRDCAASAYDEIKDRNGVMYNGAFIKSTDERYPAILAVLRGEQA
jgi:NTP pyrophosphatase (non-canonical NTP hydrolase)